MKLLLLAGSGEARVLAGHLARLQGVEATASLAGATRDPAPLPIPMRTGGFGGRAAQRDYLRAGRFDAILDATHPFAQRIKARTAELARELDIACLHLIRPAWRAGPGDDWTEISHPGEAALHVPPGATVFLATGRGTLMQFGALASAGRKLISRQIDPPDAPFPWPGGQYLVGRGPFSVADEMELLQRLGVTWLVVKNAGGAGARAKLGAARELGLPVLMLARPSPPAGKVVARVADALAWVERQCARHG